MPNIRLLCQTLLLILFVSLVTEMKGAKVSIASETTTGNAFRSSPPRCVENEPITKKFEIRISHQFETKDQKNTPTCFGFGANQALDQLIATYPKTSFWKSESKTPLKLNFLLNTAAGDGGRFSSWGRSPEVVLYHLRKQKKVWIGKELDPTQTYNFESEVKKLNLCDTKGIAACCGLALGFGGQETRKIQNLRQTVRTIEEKSKSGISKEKLSYQLITDQLKPEQMILPPFNIEITSGVREEDENLDEQERQEKRRERIINKMKANLSANPPIPTLVDACTSYAIVDGLRGCREKHVVLAKGIEERCCKIDSATKQSLSGDHFDRSLADQNNHFEDCRIIMTVENSWGQSSAEIDGEMILSSDPRLTSISPCKPKESTDKSDLPVCEDRIKTDYPLTDLLMLLTARDSEKVRSLLQESRYKNVAESKENLRVLLLAAVKAGDLKGVEFFLQRGADPVDQLRGNTIADLARENAKNFPEEGTRILTLIQAARMKHIPLHLTLETIRKQGGLNYNRLQDLLNKGDETDQWLVSKDENGLTPLELAVNLDDPRAVELILSRMHESKGIASKPPLVETIKLAMEKRKNKSLVALLEYDQKHPSLSERDKSELLDLGFQNKKFSTRNFFVLSPESKSLWLFLQQRISSQTALELISKYPVREIIDLLKNPEVLIGGSTREGDNLLHILMPNRFYKEFEGHLDSKTIQSLAPLLSQKNKQGRTPLQDTLDELNKAPPQDKNGSSLKSYWDHAAGEAKFLKSVFTTFRSQPEELRKILLTTDQKEHSALDHWMTLADQGLAELNQGGINFEYADRPHYMGRRAPTGSPDELKAKRKNELESSIHQLKKTLKEIESIVGETKKKD